MEYSLKEVRFLGKPGIKKFQEKDPDGKYITVEKYGIGVVIVTQIEDQPYAGFCNNDSTFFELDKGKSIDQNDADLQAFAAAFVADKYPST